MLPLIDLALPAIKLAPASVRDELLKALEAVIHADNRVSPHEFVVLTMLRFQLEKQHAPVAIKYKVITDVLSETIWLLSLVARAGCCSAAENAGEFDTAFNAGIRVLGLKADNCASREPINLAIAGAALKKLRMLAPLQKAMLIKALFAAITADGTIRVIETELMRMIGAVLDCPLPPLIDEMDHAALAACDDSASLRNGFP